jgi:hypothetical protein
MVEVGALDGHEVLGWLVDLLGGDDPRVAHLRSSIGRRPEASEPRFDPTEGGSRTRR